jgi:K319L-like, PKD domain
MKLLLKAAFFVLLLGYFLLSCQKEYSCESCGGTNNPPVADAGHDQAITLPKDSVTLDGSNSSDPDGTIVSYNWTKLSGPASFNINNAASVTTVVKDLEAGVYQFELEVKDNGGLSSKDTMMVTVDEVPVNHPPVANAGPDQTIVQPANTTILDGSASWDPDNNIVGYAWTKLSGPSTPGINNPVDVQTQIGNLVSGVYEFELTVTDAGGLNSKDTVLITLENLPGQPPVADAGADVTVNYNLQTCSIEPMAINLDGSASFDPDGTLVSYQWELISAINTAVIISNPGSAVTTATHLMPGIYGFSLKVTDDVGATDIDTVWINVVPVNRTVINAQLIPVGSLSQARKVSAVATIDNKILFAGGTAVPAGPGPSFSSRVDIYDITTDSWNTAELSQPRLGITAVTSGAKVLFAGGTGLLPSSRVGQTSRIDVYDVTTGFWTTLELPQAGHYSSLAQGSNVFFSGGNLIRIYNVPGNSWSAKSISQSRYLIAPANVQGKLYFSGGASTTSGGIPFPNIDIYDPAVNAWSVSDMSKPKFGIAAMGMRGKILWAGGSTSDGLTNEVEIVDLATQTTTFSCLFQPNSFGYYSLGKKDTRLVFFVWNGEAKDRFDIYDVLSNTWTIGVLNQAITPSIVISVNDEIYVAGAAGNSNGYYNQVWKLVF